MGKIGVIRKAPFSMQRQVGDSSFYFDPVGGAKDRGLPLRGTKGVKASEQRLEQMREADRARQTTSDQLAQMRDRRMTSDELSTVADEEGSDAYDQAVAENYRVRDNIDVLSGRLKDQEQAAAPQSLQDEMAMSSLARLGGGDEAIGRAARAGRVGVMGARLGLGGGAGLAALSAGLGLARGNAAGQDLFSAMGNAALSGAGTFQATSPHLQRLGGAIGSRLGEQDYRSMGQRGSALASGALNAGQVGVRAAKNAGSAGGRALGAGGRVFRDAVGAGVNSLLGPPGALRSDISIDPHPAGGGRMMATQQPTTSPIAPPTVPPAPDLPVFDENTTVGDLGLFGGSDGTDLNERANQVGVQGERNKNNAQETADMMNLRGKYSAPTEQPSSVNPNLVGVEKTARAMMLEDE